MDREEQLLYHLWLCQSCGHDPAVIHRQLKKYHTPYEAFCRLREEDRSVTLDGARKLLAVCRKKEIQVLFIEDEAYPALLREVSQPPLVLYAMGNMPDFNQMLGVGVVGTRKCSPDGATMAESLGVQLAHSGVVVVSGMAEGIDGAAHLGAMKAGGCTIAVLAGGVDLIYPLKHKRLYQQILRYGCVLSERPPGMAGKPYFYKERNRILVGLCRGTVVVEGEKKSGSSLSARLAAENNRDIFAVPSSPVNSKSELPNSLIRDGAKQVICAMDILEEYIELYPQSLSYGMRLKTTPLAGRISETQPAVQQAQKENSKKAEPQTEPTAWVEELLSGGGFQENEEVLLRYLATCKGTVSYDKLKEGTSLPSGALGSTLIILQMKKLVTKCAGANYLLNAPGISINQ